MIQAIVRKHQKLTGFLLLTVFYCDFVLAAYVPVLRCQTFQPQVAAAGPSNIFSDALAAEISQSENNAAATQEKTEGKSADVVFAEDDFGGGPSQPEMSTFQSVNSNNMVDLFTGDFSYNIPLMDVGGYPVNLSYRSGITMDQEASWVGLGWNINPGTITRNLRGVPDDFNGKADTITKISSVRDNVTTGVTAGVGAEIFGLPLNAGVNGGIFYNNYRGFGVESGANVSLSSAQHANGKFTAGLSVNNNSQEGINVTPSFSYKYSTLDEDENSGSSGSISTSLGYSSRAGLKALQIAAGYRQNSVDENNQRKSFAPNIPSGSISFALPSYLPKITIPYTSRAYSFTGKLGFEITGFDPNASISGYVSMQTQRDADTILTLPAYGYLNYQNAIKNPSALLDFNRERELPYREKPEVPHIGLPSYTYDVFSMTGEGTGGMFRAYRGDIGYVYDHYMKSKDASDAASADVAVGTYAHVGVDLNVNRSYTTTGKWSSENPLANIIKFRSSDTTYEAAYFRNPGEKSINSKTFYDALGGDDVVAAQIVQSSNSSPTISTSAYLSRYSGKRFTGTLPMSSTNVVKTQRDKRTQVISYLNAEEASLVGFSKYIESYKVNSSVNSNCNKVIPDLTGTISGLRAEYYNNKELSGNPYIRTDAWINAPDWGNSNNGQLVVPLGISNQNFSVRWNGTLKATVSGSYIISTVSDDGVRLWLNDSLFINNWTDHPETRNQFNVNLVAGNYYTLKVEYYQQGDKAKTLLQWSYPGQVEQIIPASYLYYPDTVTKATIGNIDIEERVSRFRQRNHISEIDVVNSDGRRYVYGIPVYNLIQKEVTFAANSASGDVSTGLVAYNTPKDISTGNENGQDHYFTQEITPAYAHSFLLTAILSTDYVDLTGDGVSDDDLGDGIKFNYSKIAGADNPYKWRSPAPGQAKNANYNQGLKTDTRDDKGSYVYGEKELWYLHSVESKNMVAVFLLDQTERKDLFPIDETGKKALTNQAKRLKEIRLYSKPDYLSKGLNATSIKTVHFEYSYDLCKGVNTQKNDSGKLTLKKVWFTYNGNETKKENPYIFHYASTNPVYDAKSYDRWGNYKNAANNPGGMTNADYPYALQPNYSSYATDSTLIANNAAAWNLDSIILPSGGRMKVQYESDDYAFVQHKRALQMFSIAGLGFQNDNVITQKLYTRQLLSFQDNLIVYATVNRPIQNKKQVLEQYLEGLDTVYFRLAVTMPSDANGSGEEFVPCYASIDRTGNYYGLKDANTIWFKIKGVNKDADGDGDYSPLAKTAIQFLKLNLPSKAYEGSEPGDNLNFVTAIKLMLATAENVREAIGGYETLAREKGYASTIVPLKSIVRLNNPDYRKMGGGLRVKRIKIYDNWTKSTGQKEAVYGQEYFYTTVKEINGVNTTISSGVASYEPMIGGEENPFRVPIQYKMQSAVLAPVTLGYTEEPLGESFFPSASVGYSKVRVRSINTTGKKSANGYEETCFYTTYDFPTITDRSIIDNNSKKRYKPKVANFLRILAKHYLTIAQGFKVELNDMNGKVRSQATYPETDSINPITYTENFYRVDNNQSDVKHLSNTVWTIDPSGNIDTASTIGKDVEVMMDMREQYSQNIGANVSPNVDILPVGGIPGSWWSMIGLPQYEETKFRSVATTKVIQRYGILDSVIHEEKGSRISTKNMLYDSETGDVLLTRTQNEFNDPVYNFSYPSHWAYDGMGEAYKNINAVFNGLKIKAGKIIGGMASGRDTVFFSSGDEILVSSKEKTGAEDCTDNNIATFKSSNKVWAIDSAVTGGGRKSIYFIDEDGKTFAGNDVSMKIIRSGRRNINTSVGSTTTLKNPLQKSGNTYILKFVDTTHVVNTAATEFKQLWHVSEKRRLNADSACTSYSAACSGGSFCNCECLGKLFSYLQTSRRLFIKSTDNITLTQLVQDANNAGAGINLNECPVFSNNKNGLFYSLTTDSIAIQYKAAIGGCVVAWNSMTGNPVSFYTLHKKDNCSDDNVYYDTDNNTGSVTHQILQTGLTGSQQPVSSDVLTNGNIVVVGGNTNTRHNSDGSPIGSGTVMVFNTYGANIWSRSLGIDTSICINVKALNDGGFILSGNKQESTSPEVWSIFVIRFNSSFNVVWSKNYSFNGSGLDQTDDLNLAQMVPLSDGSFVLTGTKPPIGGLANGFIFRINSSGSLLWAKEYDLNETSDNMSSIIQKGDTLITSGYGLLYSGQPDEYNFTVTKIKVSDGTVISQNIIDLTSYAGSDSSRVYNWANRLYAAPSGGYYLTYTNTNTFSPSPWIIYYLTAVTGVLKLDVNLNPVSAYDFRYGSDSLKHLSDAFISQDGNMVFATRQVIGNSDSWLHKINIETGSVVWNRRYEHLSGINRLFSIAEKANGSIFAAGEHKTTDTSKSEIFIMQTDADGKMPDGSCEDQPNTGNLQLVPAKIIPCSEMLITGRNIAFANDSAKAFYQSKSAAFETSSFSYCDDWSLTNMTGVISTQALNMTTLSPNPLYTCGYYDDTTTIAKLSIESCCSSGSSSFCISAITDTLLNPYRVGLLGNFRPYRSHIFYTDRDQVDPAVATDIRNQGEFVNYAPFWSFNNGKLVRTTDTTYWVWNSEQTLFNQKGFELENKDPLGRYNAGLYGYNLTLPIGVAQNSKYREVAFEGFEDYKYVSGICDTTCAVSYRQMDYSTWLPFLDTTQRHSGKYSLRIGVNNDNIGLSYNLTSSGTTTKTPLVKFKTASVACAGTSLQEVRTDSSALITGFSPSAGDSVIIGGWVKELQDCLCSTYVNNKVVIYYTKSNGSSTTDSVKTLGNIVEGWQRFEKAVVIPADAVKITFSLQTDKTYTTYFDDLRIHPYKANMQSFVYDPVSLRLMAELDENNYATFYEYDDDGTLIRVKKETERGIKTIKETRSVLSKRPN